MSPQQSIAHYRINAKLGEGGMGAVYRATDTKLNRDVAVKMLPEAFRNDAARMVRFEREAQVLASLNHPNIAAIYGVEAGAIVMELVEGEDLRGPLPIDTVIAYARQIATGLEAAHERGIIHRDLKPANIKVTPDGTVKLLDFGLAKANEAAAPAGSNTHSPTMSLAMTQAGMILGTAAYMSPEQARGKPVDKRADIWAFGVILFELLTGTMLFGGGETVSDSLAAVITREPDWNALPKDTPANLRRLLERCLRKDPKLRMRDIGEARLALDEPAIAPPAAVPAAARPGLLPWMIAAVALVGAAAGWWQATRPAAPRPLVRMNVEMSGDMAMAAGSSGGIFAISPDGARIVVTQRGPDKLVRLYTRLLDQSQLTAMAGTEGAGTPFFSPNGQWIGYHADGKLRKVSVAGGTPVVLCDAPGLRGASWGDDGYIVFAVGVTSNLLRVPESGGKPADLTKIENGDRSHRWPEVLPGSEAVIFTQAASAIYDSASIELVSVKTGKRKVLYRGGYAAHLVAGARGPRLLFVNQDRLFSVPFDMGRLEVTGAPVPVVDHVDTSITGGGYYAVARNGTLVFLQGSSQQGRWTLNWLDASGKTELLHGPAGHYSSPRLSPDGKRLAFATTGPQGFDLWVKDLERKTPSRLTFFPGTNDWSIWTPDGKSIIFRSTNPEAPGLYWVRADGAGEPQRLTDGKRGEIPYALTPDGKTLALTVAGGGLADIHTASLQGDSTHLQLGKLETFLATPATESHPAFSPDGRWIAYLSTESNAPEVYVRPFPGPGGKWQVSNGGGGYPIWSRSSPELFYQAWDGRINVVSYTVKGDTFVAGISKSWSPTPVLTYSAMIFSTWDLAPDGKRVVAAIPEQIAGADTHLNFVLNFLDGLK